jgi:hypothetical protein
MSETKKVNIFWIDELKPEEQYALKAMWAGEASPGQQRMAMNVIMDKISMADFLPYQAGSFDETAFLSGRSWVGKAIRRILKLKTGE